MNKPTYTYRHLANIVLEATTPLAIGSGKKDIFTDSLVITDVNGMPYIPGTSIAGVIRHMLEDIAEKSEIDQLFGFQEESGKNDKGSNFIFSEGKMIGAEGEVIDGLCYLEDNKFYNAYRNLPIRQHVRINQLGASEDNGKFDEQVVYKGTRFCFEIELVSAQEEDALFNKVLEVIHSDFFKLGSGTRCGFGNMKVVSCKIKHYNLCNEKELTEYINKSSRLTIQNSWSDWKGSENTSFGKQWVKYELTLTAKDFFLFAGLAGDAEADSTPVKEKTVEWSNNKPIINDTYYVLPATSIKGALAHRTAYHYNKIKGIFADKIAPEAFKQHTGSNNQAVRELFGLAKNDMDKEDGLRGNVLFEDIFIKEYDEYKFNHVCIDRFTGGNMNGFLFNEKTLNGKEKSSIQLNIYINNTISSDTLQAFTAALDDLCNGNLPLGGCVNKGHGIFYGTSNPTLNV